MKAINSAMKMIKHHRCEKLVQKIGNEISLSTGIDITIFKINIADYSKVIKELATVPDIAVALDDFQYRLCVAILEIKANSKFKEDCLRLRLMIIMGFNQLRVILTSIKEEPTEELRRELAKWLRYMDGLAEHGGLILHPELDAKGKSGLGLEQIREYQGINEEEIQDAIRLLFVENDSVSIDSVGGDVVGAEVKGAGNIIGKNINVINDVITREDVSGSEKESADRKRLEASTVEFDRYPYATFPAKIVVGVTAPLRVIIRAVRPAPTQQPMVAEDVTTIKIHATTREKAVSIDVIFDLPNPHFDIEGEYYKTIDLPVKVEDSMPVLFNLKAKKEGNADIKLEFFQQGTYLGELRMRTRVVPAGMAVQKDQQQSGIPEWKLTKKFPPQPDISIIITQIESSPKAKYDILFHSQEQPFIPIGSIELEDDPESRFRAIFKDIENTDLAPNIIDDRLKAKGLTLYDELFPDKLKQLYWEIRDNIRSVQVFSREPWIPWEIIRPWHKEGNAKPVEDLFLCERFNFSRWLIGTSQQIKEQIHNVKVVVPCDTKLKSVSQERDWIKQFGDVNKIAVSIDSTYEEFISTLRKGNYDMIHFSAHGRHSDGTPLLSTIELESGIPIRPENISGEATTMLDQSNPIVIMNTCQSAAQGFSLTGMQSWVTRFLDYGASAFVGTLWSVSDQTALEFTKELYNQLSEGKTIGEAVMASRIRCKISGDPSWLAYQLYAQPNTQVVFGSK